MSKIYIFVALTVIILLFSCKYRKDSLNEIEIINPYELGNYNKPGNIVLDAHFSECGEWGGHSEKTIIYADANFAIHARHKVYPFKCDSLEKYYNVELLKIIRDTTITLNYQRQLALRSYIESLIKAKMTERFPGHAGNVFSVMKADSTLLIHVYDNSLKNNSEYKKLISNLFSSQE